MSAVEDIKGPIPDNLPDKEVVQDTSVPAAIQEAQLTGLRLVAVFTVLCLAVFLVALVRFPKPFLMAAVSWLTVALGQHHHRHCDPPDHRPVQSPRRRRLVWLLVLAYNLHVSARV